MSPNEANGRGWAVLAARSVLDAAGEIAAALGMGTGAGKGFRPAFSPHALKHSAVSWLAEEGRSVDQISDLTDTDPKTVRLIYRRVNPGALRDLADELGAIVSPGKFGKTGRK